MEDGTVVDTDKASASWAEAKFWDGRNHISKATGDQFTHQTLFRSRKGRYYVLHTSQWQGSRDHIEWVSPQEAARWLLVSDHDLPEDLQQYENDLVE
jgi:hypothetical protein